MKLLKRKILFTLASEIDFFKINEGFEYYPYKFLYARLLNYKSSSIRDAVLQLAASGEIDKITRNKTVLFRLTAQGRSRLLYFFPISVGQKKVWDRIWRIAVIKARKTIKLGKARAGSTSEVTQSGSSEVEQARDFRKLRQTLRTLSFRKLSRGVYITPLPISAQLKNFLLEEKISVKIAVIESRRLLLGDDKQLAKQVWSLNSLLKEYQNLINQAIVLLKYIKGQKSLTSKAKKQFSLILDSYFSLLGKDPGLPVKLLPIDWPFDLVKETFLRLADRVKAKEGQSDGV